MAESANHPISSSLTKKILIALLLGMAFGVLIKNLSLSDAYFDFLVNSLLSTGGAIFIDLMKMLVVPVVFVSLVCGASSLGSAAKLGRIGMKTFLLYLLTTMLAVSFALCFALLFNVGSNIDLPVVINEINATPPSIVEVIRGMVPSNPINAMASGNMLQLIVFSLLLGLAMMMSGSHGKKARDMFVVFNEIMMKLVVIVMSVAPYGIFCLLAALFAKQGLAVLGELVQYFLMVAFVLLFHLFVSYGLILKLIARLNPFIFFKKMYPAMLFAFGVSSSNASIPVVLETVEEKLGVNNSVASFVIPLGATINMDGTSIMQGVATVFIAHAYHIDIGLSGYLVVILMATLASIGTAGVPSVGLITLTMVLQQVGLPTEAIALIIGVDRLLDMLRTSVNVSGDAMVSCLVAKSEKLLDVKQYNSSPAS